jgi:hypothetical protein
MALSVKMSYTGSSVDVLRSDDTELGKPSYYITPDEARSLRRVFSFLNDKDTDVLCLIFVAQKRQMDVCRLLGRKQPSLVYDIGRIRKRIRFITYINEAIDVFMDFLVRERGAGNYSDDELAVMTAMIYTTSFTTAGSVLGMNTMRTRTLMKKSMQTAINLEHWDIYEILQSIYDNLNIIRRINRIG